MDAEHFTLVDFDGAIKPGPNKSCRNCKAYLTSILHNKHKYVDTHTVRHTCGSEGRSLQTETQHKLVSIGSADLCTCVRMCSHRSHRSADPFQRWPIEPVRWVVKKSKLTEEERARLQQARMWWWQEYRPDRVHLIPVTTQCQPRFN